MPSKDDQRKLSADAATGGRDRSDADRRSPVNRRNVLTTLGGAMTAGLAGCSGSNGDGTSTSTTTSDGGGGGETSGSTTVGSPTSEFEMTTVKFSLDWIPKGDHAGFLVAQSKGFWADKNLSVQMTRGYGSDQTVKEVSSGKSEFGLAGIGTLMSGIAQGLKIRQQCAVYNNIPSIIMAHPDANISKPADLEGTKTILPSGVNTALSKTLFNKLGLDWSSLDLETRGFVETSVLVNHEADWVSESGPDLPALWSRGFEPDAYNWLNEHLGVIAKGIIVKNSYAQNNPEAVRRFVAGTLEGWQYILNNGEKGIDEAVDALFKFFPQSALSEAGEADARKFHKQNAMLMLSNLLTQGTREHGLGYFPEDKVTQTVDMFNEHLLENGNLKAEDVFNVGYIESGSYPIEFEKALNTIETVGGRKNPLLSHLE